MTSRVAWAARHISEFLYRITAADLLWFCGRFSSFCRSTVWHRRFQTCACPFAHRHTHTKKKKQGLAPCSIFTATQKMRFRHPLYHTFAFDSAKGFQSMMFQIQNDLPVRHSITFGWERHDENGASSSNLSICSCGWSVVSVGVCCCFSSIYFCSPRKKTKSWKPNVAKYSKKKTLISAEGKDPPNWMPAGDPP